MPEVSHSNISIEPASASIGTVSNTINTTCRALPFELTAAQAAKAACRLKKTGVLISVNQIFFPHFFVVGQAWFPGFAYLFF